MSKYPEHIIGDLRERRGLKRDDPSQDAKIEQMSKDKVLDEVVNWNGLINYGDTIRGWIEDIYGIEL